MGTSRYNKQEVFKLKYLYPSFSYDFQTLLVKLLASNHKYLKTMCEAELKDLVSFTYRNQKVEDLNSLFYEALYQSRCIFIDLLIQFIEKVKTLKITKELEESGAEIVKVAPAIIQLFLHKNGGFNNFKGLLPFKSLSYLADGLTYALYKSTTDFKENDSFNTRYLSASGRKLSPHYFSYLGEALAPLEKNSKLLFTKFYDVFSTDFNSKRVLVSVDSVPLSAKAKQHNKAFNAEANQSKTNKEDFQEEVKILSAMDRDNFFIVKGFINYGSSSESTSSDNTRRTGLSKDGANSNSILANSLVENFNKEGLETLSVLDLGLDNNPLLEELRDNPSSKFLMKAKNSGFIKQLVQKYGKELNDFGEGVEIKGSYNYDPSYMLEVPLTREKLPTKLFDTMLANLACSEEDYLKEPLYASIFLPLNSDILDFRTSEVEKVEDLNLAIEEAENYYPASAHKKRKGIKVSLPSYIKVEGSGDNIQYQIDRNEFAKAILNNFCNVVISNKKEAYPGENIHLYQERITHDKDFFFTKGRIAMHANAIVTTLASSFKLNVSKRIKDYPLLNSIPLGKRRIYNLSTFLEELDGITAIYNKKFDILTLNVFTPAQKELLKILELDVDTLENALLSIVLANRDNSADAEKYASLEKYL